MKRLCKNFFKGVLFGVLCVCLLTLGWLLVLCPQVTRQQAQNLKATYSHTVPAPDSVGDGFSLDETHETLDFAALQADYPDVKAWLTVPGTAIDYPVLQSSPNDPEHYLRRTYTGAGRLAGSLFFQADCLQDGRCLIVYGHNMRDGSMFGSLPEYLDAAYARQHARVYLQTSDGVQEYTIAAAMETDVTQLPFNRTTFCNDADFLAFADQLLAASVLPTTAQISTDSRLLLLVTCSYASSEARYVVVAVG